jgi:hypothetical protein
MRKVMLVAPMLLAGCAAAQAPIHGVTAGHKCGSVAPSSFVGEPATSELGSAILTATHAAVLRWAPPGVMLTMEYREDRVTVRIGQDGRVAAVNCG